jgi:alkylation response protein AidB-like acyl-CoA dehydrogenase
MKRDLDADQQLLYETTSKFVANESPVTVVRSWTNEPTGWADTWWERGNELGWTSLLAPERFDGGPVSGEPVVELGLIADVFGRGVLPGPLAGTNAVVRALSELGSDEQQSEHLPPILSGDVVPGWCVAEPGAAADEVYTVKATAVAADGGFRLRGVKAPVESGGMATWFLVTARTGEGLGQFVVPSGPSGLSVRRLEGLDAARRYAEVALDDVFVPTTSRLGSGDVTDAVERQFQTAIVAQLAETVGSIDRVFGFTLEWSFDRYSFGRPLASYQELKHRFADMRMWLEACHATADAAARAVHDGAPDAALLVSVAKSYVGEFACELVHDCVQMHGGIGVTAEHDLHLYLRRVTQNRVLLGSPYAHRQRIAHLLEETL